MPNIPYYEPTAENVLEELKAHPNVKTAKIKPGETTTITVTFYYRNHQGKFTVTADNITQVEMLALDFLKSIREKSPF